MLLEPVLLNLVRNAWQATKSIEKPRVELLARINGRGNIIIEVTDNGAGISKKIIKKVFIPFFTTRPEGSGVGLALAKQVMTAHGGFIQAANILSTNEKINGIKFTLTF